MRTITLGILSVVLATSVVAQNRNPEDAYRALKSQTTWVHDSMRGKVDEGMIEAVAKGLNPYQLNVLVVPGLGGKWVRGGDERRNEFTKYVAESKLNSGSQGITIVLTRKGISAYNSKLSPRKLDELNRAAAKKATASDFTPAVTTLAQSVRTELNAVPSRSSSAPISGAKSSGNIWGGLICIMLPLAIAGIVIAVMAANKKKKIANAKRMAEEMKSKAVEALSYLDSYDGLLGDAQPALAVRQYRERMGQNFDSALSSLNRSKTAEDYEAARRAFGLVLADFDSAKAQVEAATGGTGVAFTIPPIIDQQRAPLFEPVQGVSYFSSMPSDQLVPVEINFGGSRKTVMVTPEERDELMAGRMPQLRGQYQGDRFVPWYGVRGYDPYRDYDSRDFLWNLMAISAISHAFTPHYGYGWGGGLFGGGYGYGGTTIINNNYGGSDFGGGNYGSDFGNSDSGDFSFDSGNDSSGDFDFGGGDSGGFDFGGGDFGGGDFGGGDF